MTAAAMLLDHSVTGCNHSGGESDVVLLHGVGLDGEIEHGSALIHTLKFGDHFRKAADATTLLPAVEKRAGAGTVFDVPLKHITDATIRSHHQSIEVRIADAPHADEIVVGLAAAGQGRPQARLAPLSSEQ